MADLKTTVGFVGVGTMGAGMVANLCRNGFPVSFLHRGTERGKAACKRLVQEGAKPVSALRDLAASCQAVFLCLPDSAAVEAVVNLPSGLASGLRSGSTVIDCSSSYPESTRRLAEGLATRGVTVLDAPLTGSRAQAEAGTLTVLGGGPRDAFELCRPMMAGFASHIFYLGGTGAGHAAKLMNNFFGQLALAGLCETWPLLARYGIDTHAFFEAISISGGNSNTFQGVFPRLLRRDFTQNFTQTLACKDMAYLVRAMQAVEGSTPLADCMAQIYRAAVARGFGDLDVTELLRFYETYKLDAKQASTGAGR